MQHYCPLHPLVLDAIRPLLDNRQNDEPILRQLSFARWLRTCRIPLTHGGLRFLPSDLRKFCEQQGDTLQWDQLNKNYMLTHGVSGVDWRFYKHPLPASVYDVYMKYWPDLSFETEPSFSDSGACVADR